LFYLLIVQSIEFLPVLLILLLASVTRFVILFRFCPPDFVSIADLGNLTKLRVSTYLFSLVSRVFPQLERILLSSIGYDLLGQIYALLTPINRLRDMFKSLYKEDVRKIVLGKTPGFKITLSIMLALVGFVTSVILFVYYDKSLDLNLLPIFILSGTLVLTPAVIVNSTLDLYFNNGTVTRLLDVIFNVISISCIFIFVSDLYSYFYVLGVIILIKYFIQKSIVRILYKKYVITQ
jgi:hypothetical protein